MFRTFINKNKSKAVKDTSGHGRLWKQERTIRPEISKRLNRRCSAEAHEVMTRTEHSPESIFSSLTLE
ncbi:hypothetical protein MHYP_G00017530 [Metynnis hypsauchen]